ncbi:GntR family transcriptional regulator [Streptacidiphilus carbonis]|uniref:GntR family transcriptional regulator n=1 Tax=Streptacidiphilus carbonis TaxID=105422 RepID=UPI0013777BC6|nr:GntR family transcriptional regulator [Streptacidiphilus carbonis]
MTDSRAKRIGYRDISESLRGEIEGGTYPAALPLPAESDLAKRYGVARETVRRALADLEERGLLRTVHGRGRFVSDQAGGIAVGTKHEQVATALRQQITAGRLRPGDSLPSEAEVCSRFDVSRTTARAAFAELKRAGLARSEQGKGYIVTEPPNFHDDGDRSTAWQVHGERPIYENYWVTVTQADIQTPDGERFDHHKVYLPPAAMAAMLDDQGRVFMMWRHRFVSDTWNWELPGGVVEDGEDPKDTAVREILEETGYRPIGEVEHVVSFEPMIGTVASPHHVFVVRGVEYVAEPTEVNESQKTAWVPLSEIPGLIARGEIANSGALIALLYLLAGQTVREPSGSL